MSIRPIVMTWTEAEVINPDDGTAERRMVMVPKSGAYRAHAERQYRDDAEYTLAPVEQRSRAAHSRYFAALNDAFMSLPEKVMARWENVEHFRKWVLIEVGFYTEKEFPFSGRHAETQARRLAAFIRAEDDYARIYVVKISGDTAEESTELALDKAVAAWGGDTAEPLPLRDRMRLAIRAALKSLTESGRTSEWKVIVRRAQSQDHASMTKGPFKESSDKVLAYAEDLIGTPRGTLRREAGMNA